MRRAHATDQYAAVLGGYLALAAAQSSSLALSGPRHGAQRGVQATGAVCTSACYTHQARLAPWVIGWLASRGALRALLWYVDWPFAFASHAKLSTPLTTPCSRGYTHLGPVLHMRGLRFAL